MDVLTPQMCAGFEKKTMSNIIDNMARKNQYQI